MDIKLSGFTLSQWQEIQLNIDSMELHDKVYGALPTEAKEELYGVIKELMQMGMDDETFADNILGETPESLTKMADKSYDELLSCHPVFTWGMLTTYIVGQVDELETQIYSAENGDNKTEDDEFETQIYSAENGDNKTENDDNKTEDDELETQIYSAENGDNKTENDEDIVKVVLKMTPEHWQELERPIDNIQVFQNVYDALSEEAQNEYRLYVDDMISEGLDFEQSRVDYNISLETLEILKEMDFTQKLSFAPEFLFARLAEFIVYGIEKCECESFDSSDSDINVDENKDTINRCPCCILL